tara:strand:- start:863 stop:2548 length:1686 start_codon:yes stop_codon:yes gene_type:complete
MFQKKIILVFIISLFYQTSLFSKSTSYYNFDSKNLSKYFSGIVAFENKDNTDALSFFNTTKILIESHDPYLKKYLYSLVLESQVNKAINLVKSNKGKDNTNFFDAYLLLILDDLRKGDFKKAYYQLDKAINLTNKDKFNLAILESLKQYIYVFKEKKILNDKKNFGKLSIISETFQRCYLGDISTDKYFSKLVYDDETNYTRYIFFYLSYLIENNRFDDVKKITDNLNYINTTLLLSQGKSWVENKRFKKLTNVFSCKNPNDIISEFLFLISNIYSSEDDFEKSNFYLNLSNFLNPKFVFNFSLIAENQFLNGEYKKAKKTLKNFKKEDNFYYWYRIKKESQIIAKQKNQKESLNYIVSKFNKIIEPNNRILFDIANFYKNSKEYSNAIKYYTKLINSLSDNLEIKPDLLYRRGGSYERSGAYEQADKDLLDALSIKPDDAYILNYLAYSWLERDYKIDEAINMLEKAYKLENNDPYIIDSIGWAYYLVNDYLKAEKFIKRAVELMPDDPIVNDHYGDILWMLDRKIQARYFWNNVIEMENTENDMIENINKKIIEGLKKS